MNRKLAYFLGALHDAHLIHRPLLHEYGFEIEQKSKEYAQFLAKLVRELFGVNVSLKLRKRTWGTYYRLRLYSKRVYLKLMTYNFKELLISSPKTIKRELIRGLFDAEGSVSSNEVRMFNKDLELLELSKKAIEELGVKCGRIIKSKGNVLQLPIYAKEHKRKFMELFKPQHPGKIMSF